MSDPVQGKIFYFGTLLKTKCLALLTFKSCLVPIIPQRSMVRCFGSRSPSEEVSCLFALDMSTLK